MRKVAFALGGMLWFVVVLYVAFRVTFPSDALVERARYELDHNTRGSMAVDIDSVSPWWVGLKASDVTLYAVSGGEGEATTLVHADQARVSVSPWSLLRRSPAVSGRVFMGDGDIRFSAVAAATERGGTEMHALSLDATKFPLSAVPPIAGASLVGKGTVDLAVDLDAPDGMNKAEGRASLSGKDLIIEDVQPFGPMLQPLGILPVLLEDIDLELAVTQGKAAVKRGKIVTSLGTVDLDGEITLQDDLGRSRLRLTVVIELTPEASAIGAMLGAPKWGDGKLHGSLSGQLGRPSFRWDSERSSRTSSRPAPADGDTVRSTPAASTDLEERRRRAAERRERAMEGLRTTDAPGGVLADPVGMRVRPITHDEIEEPAEIELDTEEPPLDDEIIEEELPFEE